MATAYAALVSLMNVLTRFQHPSCPVSFDQPLIQSLLSKVNSLVDFLEPFSQRTSLNLLQKIVDAAFAAEDLIESYYVDQVLERSTSSRDKQYDFLCQDLEKTIHGMDLILMEVKEMNDEADQLPVPECSLHGSALPLSGTAKMVGFDEYLLQLMDELTSSKSSRQVIPVVGMGGIGKTTLARNVYNHSYIRHHFHIRAWATISQDYNVEKILRVLLHDMHVDVAGYNGSELGEQLYKALSGRKYLIVLDDIWDTLAWVQIKMFFPNNCNGSRFLLTTRLSNVALEVGSCSPHEIKLLDDNESWKLLSETVFGEEVCPSELKKCGEKIAKSCKGLPLAIVVVGGLLKMSEKTLQHWENVAENTNSFIKSVENDGHCMEIFSLSYNHLPTHLKPCFLYMATFEEDNDISVFSLTNLWAADGFLRPTKGRTLEEIALEYLNDFVNRNLIMVTRRGSTGKISSCNFHDLLREFCSGEAQKEGFLCHLKKDMPFGSERRLVCNQHKGGFHAFPSMPLARSLICGFDDIDFTSCRLLRVLIVSTLNMNIRGLVNLRYLACQVDADSDVSRVFHSVSLFWNLETLLLFRRYETLTLPPEFWELANLRHFISELITYLPDPTNAPANCVLDSLETLSNIRNFNCSDEVLNKIPNLKTLQTTYFLGSSEYMEDHSYQFSNLARLPKLEELSCYFKSNGRNHTSVFVEPKNLTFAPNLRALALNGCYIPWENMTIVGSLPKLVELILEDNAFYGDEWNSTEGDFQCLKQLSIDCCHLRIWKAESSHFPRLENLSLSDVDLEKIPLDIGDIVFLQTISLDTMNLALVLSAKEIQDERQNQGGDVLHISCRYNGKPEDLAVFEDFFSDNPNFFHHFRLSHALVLDSKDEGDTENVED